MTEERWVELYSAYRRAGYPPSLGTETPGALSRPALFVHLALR
jgi:hypothetical protein